MLPDEIEQPEEPEAALTVLNYRLSPSEKHLGVRVRGALKRLRDGNWQVTVARSRVAVAEVLYAADSKRKPGQEQPDHLRGQVKSPARTDIHWWCLALYRPLRLGIELHWVEGVTAKGRRSFGFQEAMAAEPVGVPSELFVNYEPSARDLRQLKDEPEWAHQQRAALARANAERMSHEYNDGRDFLNTRPVFRSWADVDAWLSDWQGHIDRVELKEAA